MAAKRMQPPLPNRGTVDANVSKPNEKSVFCDNSPAKKVKGATPHSHERLERLMADANTRLTMLFSDFTEVLRERASADSMQVKELGDLLIEARDLEAHLKEKKEHLRHSLAVISQKLQA
ncbi:hypothetical protein ACEWY4_019170 [Coilia grayii]|uniref:Uncharacterized protein n=1 Tax=Coilia grayii TaxID=363190 RepID=A0ABD1JFB9_9TELE